MQRFYYSDLFYYYWRFEVITSRARPKTRDLVMFFCCLTSRQYNNAGTESIKKFSSTITLISLLARDSFLIIRAILSKIILAIAVSWMICAIITVAGGFPTDPSNPQYKARTDARIGVLKDAKWFRFPYPGKACP